MNENSKFDDLIRKKLEELDSKMPENAWQSFSDRNDRIFDEAVKDKLSDVKVPYSEASWRRIRNTLDERQRKPVLYIMAVTASLLLLLVVGQSIYFSNYRQPISDSKSRAVMTKASEKSATTQLSNEGFINSRKLPESIKIEPKESTPNIDGFANNNTTSNLTPAEHLLPNKMKNLDDFLKQQVETAPQAPTPAVVSTPDLNKLYGSFSDIFTDQQNDLEKRLFEGGDAAVDNTFELDEEGVLDYVETPKIKLLQTNFRLLPKSTQLSNSPWSAGVYVAGDYNTVLTPRIEDLSLDPFVNHGVGYSSGFSLSYNRPDWFLEAGLQISSNRYEPKPVQEVSGDLDDGYRINSLKRVELNIVRMPVNFMYKFLKNDRFDLYSVTGVSLNVAFTANYFRQTQFIGADPTLRTFNASSNSVIEAVPYSNGFLEGGAFSQNRYLSVNAGVGMQYQLTDRFSLYTQPIFQYGFSKRGIGPLADRYHSLSVLMGTKISLGKN